MHCECSACICACIRIDGTVHTVEPGGADPVCAELLDVEGSGLSHEVDEVVAFRVAPLLLLEVHPYCIPERVVADVEEELLEHGRTLAIGDAVEGVLSFFGGLGVTGDCVC